MPHLLQAHGKQVIVMSHVQKITDRLRDLNQHLSTKHYHYESFGQGGPQIIEQVRLGKLLGEVKGGAAGNESNRLSAVARMRVLVEAFIRELHLKATGAPAPATLDAAQPHQLLTLYRSIPGTDQAEHAGLKDTVEFCHAPHHTQVGYSAPQQSQITPHINRLEGLMKKHSLIS